MCQYTLLNLCEFINQITSCEWNSCSLKGVIELHCVCIERTKINLKLTCFYIIISVAVKISSKIACACYCVTAHTCHVTRINSYRYIFLYRIWLESRGQALNWNNNFGSSHIMRDWQLWQYDSIANYRQVKNNKVLVLKDGKWKARQLSGRWPKEIMRRGCVNFGKL